VKLGAQTSVNAEELLVHDRSKRESAEGFHACLVHCLGVLVLALELESEIVCKMTTFVVAPKEPESVGIPDLQRPQVKNALQ